MSINTIEVELINHQKETLRRLRLPLGAIPAKNTQFHVNISKCGIYKNSEYMVDDVITDYFSTDNSDGYGSYGETTIKVKLIVTLLSYQTNE